MKKLLLIFASAFTLMALLPLIAAGNIAKSDYTDKKEASSDAVQNSVSKENSTEESRSVTKRQDCGEFRILDTSSGRVITLSERDFLIGALAYEMPPTYETEALKAQCIACYTHFYRLKLTNGKKNDPSLKGADFAADLSKNQYYLNDSVLKEKWRDNFTRYHKKFEQIVDDCGYHILYNEANEPIDVCYHAISAGSTENGNDIFGIDSTNLRSVPSPWDKTAPGYLSTVTVSEEEMRSLSPDSDSTPAEKLIGKVRTTPSGSVLEIVVGGKSFKGSELRKKFGLRSAAFSVNYEKGSFVFTVRGYGHGVGMSQYGANCMAHDGASCEEILSHYYSLSW